MADQEIKETQAEAGAVLTGTASIAPQVTMTGEEIVKQLGVYKANADSSLAKIQENIDKVTDQLNGLNRMRLMILGQREIVNDLVSRATSPVTTEVSNAK